MEKFDREKFNNDPKHEEKRSQFDTMVEDAFERIAKRKEAEAAKNPKPPAEKGFLDEVLDGLFTFGK